MGMALSIPSDRSASAGTKAGLVRRIRKKFNWLKDDKQKAVSEPPKQSGREDQLQPTKLPPKERRRFSEGQALSSRSLQPPVAPSRAASLNENSLREGVRNGIDTSSLSMTERESESRIAAAASEAGVSEMDDGEASKNGELILRSLEDEEMEWKWILNLSMHFRDQSDREKFFVTYAERPNLRRRLTVSCDYRDALEGTLERELAEMKYQRDKSAKIYEAIKESLPAIQFYETITNLKLQTSNGRLHVHVTEDVHEIIPYPPVIAIAHLRCPKYKESELEFESHLSGFVYKVKVNGQVYIKKEIPGPDTVDEFLYEINALYALADSEHVISFGGCVVDEKREKVKGLLISFASKGALIDIVFHEKGRLPWRLREKWAKQIVTGLSEVHEAGYVQGDFTLSNIVIDEDDNAKIIDINRRGCPVGWEPPEVTAMIDGLQRIGMYIGVKSDLFQLGMVLWGIAHEIDEPEVVRRPLEMHQAPEDVPQYFREIVGTCLSDRPQNRLSAKEIVALFPEYSDGYVPRLGERHSEDDIPESGGRNNGYVISEAVDGIVEVTLNGNRNGNGLGPHPNSNNEYNGGNGLLLNARSSPDSDSTFTHIRSNSTPRNSYGVTNPTEGGVAYLDMGSIQTQRSGSDEDLQVISASPSESGVGDEQPFVWSSIAGAVFGAGVGTEAEADSAVPDGLATSPDSIPPSQPATNIRGSIDGSEGQLNPEEQNRNTWDEPAPRPPMNGRVATRDSDIGIERFTTARSSLDIRRSVAV